MDIDDLIARAAERTGLETGRVRIAAAGALGLLDRHAGQAELSQLYAGVAGAEELARSPEGATRSGGGLFGGLMKSAGGVSGKAMADAMGLMDRLRAQGLDREDVRRLVPALREAVRTDTGRDLLGEAVRSVPGVGGLLGADQA